MFEVRVLAGQVLYTALFRQRRIRPAAYHSPRTNPPLAEEARFEVRVLAGQDLRIFHQWYTALFRQRRIRPAAYHSPRTNPLQAEEARFEVRVLAGQDFERIKIL
ncbi:MAG: hypothetical protein HYS55_03625 [Candidatus Omnitrophica bacterium]|nr:hypothetical protein [Candidatus Omnitrophota bacterium]